MLVYKDRYGYITQIAEEDENPNDFFRRCENFSPEANLDYAVGTICTVNDDLDVEAYNVEVAKQF